MTQLGIFGMLCSSRHTLIGEATFDVIGQKNIADHFISTPTITNNINKHE